MIVDDWAPLPAPAVYVNTAGSAVLVRVPKAFTTLTQSTSLLTFTVSVSTVPFFAKAGLNAAELMFSAAAGDAMSIGSCQHGRTDQCSRQPTTNSTPRIQNSLRA